MMNTTSNEAVAARLPNVPNATTLVRGLQVLLRHRGFSETGVHEHVETIVTQLAASLEAEPTESAEVIAKRARRILNEIPKPLQRVEPEPNPRMVEYIAALPAIDRRIVSMVYVDALSIEEIANRLSMSPAEVQRRKRAILDKVSGTRTH